MISRSHILSFLVFFLVLNFACKTPKPGLFQLPDPVDTFTKPIEMQDKKQYDIPEIGIHADNLFDGARLNGFEKVDDTTVRAVISPENSPINESAYFSFRIWADQVLDINLELLYPGHEHRYIPKLSYDGNIWWPMHQNNFDTLKADSLATLHLTIGPDKLWVSAQEVINSTKVKNWAENVTKHPDVKFELVGKSKLGRDMMKLDIYQGSALKKHTIVIISRQHPPEVTGYMAMESFVEEILADNKLSNDFRRKHRILVFPLMNPDGVDLGHWRHNAGGIDLNRDWAYYRQEETAVVTNHIVEIVNRDKNKVMLGLDFHSTQRDLYYTFDESMVSVIPNFKDYWLAGIDQGLDNYIPDDRPNGLETPISKAWFYLQFGAESITYEIGDETSREFVRAKGKRAAQEMMKLLILK